MLRGSVQVKSYIFRCIGVIGVILSLTLAFTCLAAAQGQVGAVLQQANELLATKQFSNIEQAIELLKRRWQVKRKMAICYGHYKAYLYLGDLRLIRN